MNTLSRLATAFAAGAAAMYFLDPTVGRRRRALVRDKGVAARHDLEDYARATGKRAADHLQGAAAEARAQVAAGPVGDQRLHDRIRSGLGRMVERPGDVSVHVQDGRVVLMGSASTDEIEALATSIAAMRGVCDVDVRLSEPAARH